MSPHPNFRFRLRVHQSSLRRARVNLHTYALPAQGVLQIARAATLTGIARPSNVPTLWRRALVESAEEPLLEVVTDEFAIAVRNLDTVEGER